MDDKEFIKVVYRLRKAQKRYSSHKKELTFAQEKTRLAEVKRLEEQVDQELELRFESLFLGDK